MSEFDLFSSAAGETLEAEIDVSRIRPFRAGSVDTEAAELAYPDFTYRWEVGDLQGWRNLHLRGSMITKRTNVFVSISEADPIVSSVDPVPTPFLGAAAMSVANVSPYNGGVWVKVHVNWNAPLYTVVSYAFIYS